MKTIILCLALCFSSNVLAKKTSTTLQIIFDTSGVLIDVKQAEKYKLLILTHLKQLTRKRELAHAHIDVISSSIGRTVWSGTPSDLKQKPARALALVNAIKAKSENCNNLSGSFAEVKSNLKSLQRQGFTKAHVIMFSSLIDTPRPCNETTSITLPQTPPLQGNINVSLTSSNIVRGISFYWVSPHQKNVWEEFIEPSFKWAASKNIPMRFMDIERSKFSLERGLKLEVSK